MSTMINRADEQSYDKGGSMPPGRPSTVTNTSNVPIPVFRPPAIGELTVSVKPVLDAEALEALVSELETAIRTALSNALSKTTVAAATETVPR